VLAVYKQLLRAAQSKPHFIPEIRRQFRANMDIPKREINRIEFLIRQAKKKIELVEVIALLLQAVVLSIFCYFL
jgi:succinate dehydrogenase assembly factor 1